VLVALAGKNVEEKTRLQSIENAKAESTHADDAARHTVSGSAGTSDIASNPDAQAAAQSGDKRRRQHDGSVLGSGLTQAGSAGRLDCPREGKLEVCCPCHARIVAQARRRPEAPMYLSSGFGLRLRDSLPTRLCPGGAFFHLRSPLRTNRPSKRYLVLAIRPRA
jgi:hypothetical protein